MTQRIVAEKTRAMRIGVVGSGQAGSRLAETFYKLGYNAVCINTASQDLKHISIPDEHKLLLQYGLGGASKDREIGQAAAENYRQDIYQLIHQKLVSPPTLREDEKDCDFLLFTTSLGGGSGSGSVEPMIDILSSFGMPLMVMAVLPMSNEDFQAKQNAIQALSILAKNLQSKKITNLIVVDNAKIEAAYANISQLDFYQVSNNVIVEPLDAFNFYASQPSQVKSMDPMEFAKIMVDGLGLSVYGCVTVRDYMDESAIAKAVSVGDSSGLLASGFDLTQAKYAGILFVANRQVWSQVSNATVNYVLGETKKMCGDPNSVFVGIYESDTKDDSLKVYSIFSGLSLPEVRVSQLKSEVSQATTTLKAKDQQRSAGLTLDTGTEESVNAAEKIRAQIAKKNSAFGSLVGIKDRRGK